jgi:hypothetical protein
MSSSGPLALAPQDYDTHTAGPTDQDRNIRLVLLGAAPVGSGPCRSEENDADKLGMERVEGSGYCEPALPKLLRIRLGRDDYNVPLWEEAAFIAITHATVRISHRFANTLYREAVWVSKSLL